MTDISVVIPTFRRPLALAEAIGSVLRQTEVTFEIIVADDCPEGSARDVVSTLADSRLRYHHNPRPTGGVPSVVRNLAWPYTTGTFVHFLDDDDIIQEGHYAAAKAAFDANPKVGLVFGRIEPFGVCPPDQLEHEKCYFAEAARRASRCGHFGPRLAFVSGMLFSSPMLVCSAGIVRRASVERVGGFDPEIRLMEDADFYVRVMRECGACFIDRTAIRYRIGTPSLMHSPSPPAAQIQEQRAGRKRMQRKYCKQRGALEFYALAAFSRTIGRMT